MKLSVGELRRLLGAGIEEAVQSDALPEAKVGASPGYMKKERVREALQQVVVRLVRSGDVSDEASLKELFATADMALKALKMVPIDVWTKIAGDDKA